MIRRAFTRCEHCGGPVSMEVEFPDLASRSQMIGSLIYAIQQAVQGAIEHSGFRSSEIYVRGDLDSGLEITLKIYDERYGPREIAILRLSKSACYFLSGADQYLNEPRPDPT